MVTIAGAKAYQPIRWIPIGRFWEGCLPKGIAKIDLLTWGRDAKSNGWGIPGLLPPVAGAKAYQLMGRIPIGRFGEGCLPKGMAQIDLLTWGQDA